MMLSGSSRNTRWKFSSPTWPTIGDDTPLSSRSRRAPLDWGSTFRIGARFAPGAIRRADYLDDDGKRPHLPTGIDPMEIFDVADVGDLVLPPGDGNT